MDDTAFVRGYDAFLDGYDYDDNPEDNPTLRGEWTAGWVAAKEYYGEPLEVVDA